MKSEVDFLKGRFGQNFINKIEKVFTAVGAMEYELMVFKTQV